MRPRPLARDTRGTATIEFALISSLFFVTVLVALDFGIYMQQRLKLGQAVEGGAMIAFNARSSAPTVDTGTIGSYVSAAAGGSPTTAFQCNGQASCGSGMSQAQQSMCVGAPAATGGWPTFTAATTGADGKSQCASGGTPGFYLVVRATRAYRAVVVPNTMLGSSIVQQAVVRLR